MKSGFTLLETVVAAAAAGILILAALQGVSVMNDFILEQNTYQLLQDIRHLQKRALNDNAQERKILAKTSQSITINGVANFYKIGSNITNQKIKHFDDSVAVGANQSALTFKSDGKPSYLSTISLKRGETMLKIIIDLVGRTRIE
jgi:prepilin-type N-terminal cleavage/methylation domain-containing protein